MKIQIELTEEQLNLIINSLEITFRTMMGQGNIVADLLAEIPLKKNYEDDQRWYLAFNRYIIERNAASKVINALSAVLWDYGKLPADAHRYSDMWSAFRHLQYQLHPHERYDTRESEPFAMSDYPMIKVELMEEEELSDES